VSKCVDLKCIKAIGGRSCLRKVRKRLWISYSEKAMSGDFMKTEVNNKWAVDGQRIRMIDNIYIKDKSRCPLDVNEHCADRVIENLWKEIKLRVKDAKRNDKKLYKVGISIKLLLGLGFTEEAVYFIKRDAEDHGVFLWNKHVL
jgi:hypothetical protein